MTVFHGSICEVRCPDLSRSKKYIDFGPGLDMYRRGIWDEQRTLKEIAYYEDSSQVAINNAAAISELLSFTGSYEVAAQ